MIDFVDVGHNRISVFPTKIQVLNFLLYLNLDSLNVANFPSDIFEIEGLKSLVPTIHSFDSIHMSCEYLGNIALTQIPTGFNIKALEELFDKNQHFFICLSCY